MPRQPAPAAVETPNITKKWLRVGGSFGVLLDRPLMAKLGMEPETPLGIATDGQSILIRPIHDHRLKRTPPLHLVKSLVRLGHTYALLIDKGLLGALGFDPTSQPVEIITDGESMVLRRPDSEDEAAAEDAAIAVKAVVQNAVTVDLSRKKEVVALCPSA